MPEPSLGRQSARWASTGSDYSGSFGSLSCPVHHTHRWLRSSITSHTLLSDLFGTKPCIFRNISLNVEAPTNIRIPSCRLVWLLPIGFPKLETQMIVYAFSKMSGIVFDQLQQRIIWIIVPVYSQQ